MKDKSVLRSGILLLPVISAAIVFTLVSGFLVAAVKYYVPFMYLASTFLAIGLGLLTMLTADSSMAQVLGFQVPAGVGLGLALQQTVLAAQTVLEKQDIPIGLSIIVLSQTLGGTVSLAACRAIFAGALSTNVAKAVPSLDGTDVVNSGVTNLRASVPLSELPQFLKAYNDAIHVTWYLPLALACASVLGAIGMEWRKVAGPAAAGEEELQEIGQAKIAGSDPAGSVRDVAQGEADTAPE